MLKVIQTTIASNLESSDGDGDETRIFDNKHVFQSRFEETDHGYVENVHGGLIQFQFEHTPLPSPKLQDQILDRDLCESLFQLPTLDKKLVVTKNDLRNTCLEDSESVYGWKGRSTAIWLFGRYKVFQNSTQFIL